MELLKDLPSGLTKIVSVFVFCLWTAASPLAQTFSETDLAYLQEKLYFETNTSFFIPGESILVSLQCFVNSGEPSPISKVAYLELIDAEQKSVLQKKIQLTDGVGSGNLYLPTYLQTGAYTLIAYTRWMKNYSTDFIPTKRIAFANPYESFGNTFFKPDSATKIQIDFFPESGFLVPGKQQRIAYKAKETYTGKNVPVDGQITNSAGESVASFKSLKGFGFFDFTPTDDDYRAILVGKDGNVSFHPMEMTNTANTKIQVQLNEDKITLSTAQVNEVGEVYLQSMQGARKELSFVGGSLQVEREDLPGGLNWLVASNIDGRPILQIPAFSSPERAPVKIATDKNTYKPRARVSLTLELPDLDPALQYSLSVRKKENTIGGSAVDLYFLQGAQQLTSKEFDLWELAMNSELQPQSLDLPTEPQHLPDLRGNVVTGTLVNDALDPISNTSVALTIPTDGYRLATGTTNGEGTFFLITDDEPISRNLIFYTSENSRNTNLSIVSPFLKNHEFVAPWEFTMFESDKDWLLQKSIAVQVENAYYEAKENTSLNALLKSDFFPEENTRIYDLDDFTRFPTVEDAIREFVSEAWLRKTPDGAEFSVPYASNPSGDRDTTLALLNGIPVDPDWILAMNPLEIDKIEVYQKQIMVGSWEFRGIINFQLYEFDTDRVNLPPNYKEISYELPDQPYQMPLPQYADGGNTRIPDFRSQLYWNPLITPEGDQEISFYTSDNFGTYEVVLTGVIDDQTYVMERRTFEVRE